MFTGLSQGDSRGDGWRKPGHATWWHLSFFMKVLSDLWESEENQPLPNKAVVVNRTIFSQEITVSRPVNL